MTLLGSYLEAYNIVDTVSFDMSLARGLDYYTRLMYEVITAIPNREDASKNKKQEVQIGSIAAGGRYDNLVGMYGNHSIPCVGVSFGVDRNLPSSRLDNPRRRGSVGTRC